MGLLSGWGTCLFSLKYTGNIRITVLHMFDMLIFDRILHHHILVTVFVTLMINISLRISLSQTLKLWELLARYFFL